MLVEQSALCARPWRGDTGALTVSVDVPFVAKAASWKPTPLTPFTGFRYG